MVLLVVDTQNAIMTQELYRFDAFVQNVQALIASARQNSTEVVYIRHYDGVELTRGTPGFQIFDRFAPQDTEIIFDKNCNSAFRDTGLLEYLRKKNEAQIMVAGLQTDYCIDATVKCGFEHGFQMILPAGCNTTVDNVFMTGEQSYCYYNEAMWPKRYANCIGLAQALVRK